MIEGAGGVLVPVNRTSFVIELVSRFDAEVVLVVRNYLGCINHSLLTLHYLLHHNYRLKGLVLNGDFESGVREVICDKFNLPVLLEIPEMEKIGKIEISKLSTAMKW